MRALVISPDGTVDLTLTMPNGDAERLAWLQQQVGGWVEAFRPVKPWLADWVGWCDEDGKLKGYPRNERATELARIAGWSTPAGMLFDELVGTIVFTGYTPDADVAGVPDDPVRVARDPWPW